MGRCAAFWLCSIQCCPLLHQESQAVQFVIPSGQVSRQKAVAITHRRVTVTLHQANHWLQSCGKEKKEKKKKNVDHWLLAKFPDHMFWSCYRMSGLYFWISDEAVDLPCFLFRAAVFIRLKSPFAAHFKLCKFSFVSSECSCVQVPLCVCVCVWVHVLRTVSMDKILSFTNTLIMNY